MSGADMSVASCILPLKYLQPLVIQRRSRAAMIKGVQAENPPLLINITAHIQTAKPQELVKLNAGDRVRAALHVWSEALLRTASVGTDVLADRFVFQANLYEVMEIDDRTATDNFYRALAIKVGQ